ncbi:COMPASS subunit protein [Pichia kluyveri]|uniref:COMPASS subunit protein n=1 Tax=Pichia kluyveri TaxID=36015 RepID=A0AAV5RAA3_PICKL|nr:COMPASS subunit protein [Pichia kluyveri]
MNLSLHDPQFITAEYPTTLTMTLSYGHSTSLQFSPCGHYIASGLLDGTILIIDTWTNNVTTIIKSHTMPITGLRWIYNENYCGLLSWSRDWKICIHELENSEINLIWENVFTGGVWNVDIIKQDLTWDNWMVIVCKVDGGICIVKNGEIIDIDVGNENIGVSLCCFSFFNGKYVITGTSMGWLQIIDIENLKVIKNIKICNGNIKGVEIVEKAYYDNESNLLFGLNNVPINRLIVNSSDRIIKQYDISNWYKEDTTFELEIEQKYQDVVNRIQWNTVKFSPTGEFVCASSQGGSGAAHDVYVWETSMGSLVQILEGAHEELIDVHWATRSINGNVCCVCANGMDSGTIFIWGVKPLQKWSALAPDFEEIEQNIDYIEMEDEFDLNEEIDEINDEKIIDYKVDVVTREQTDARGFKFIKGCIIDTKI